MSRKLTALKIMRPKQVHKASVIIFHGSGDSGNSFSDWIKSLIGDFEHSHIKFLFPTAPLQRYTAMGGRKTYIWFDREEISPFVSEIEQSIASISSEIKNLIGKEVDSGIGTDKIIVGGFSMGGTLALHTAYRFVPGLCGVFALSSFLSKDSTVYDSLKSNGAMARVPLFFYHGDRDSVVEYEWGRETFDKLTALGVKGTFKTCKGCKHEIEEEELTTLMSWINAILSI